MLSNAAEFNKRQRSIDLENQKTLELGHLENTLKEIGFKPGPFKGDPTMDHYFQLNIPETNLIIAVSVSQDGGNHRVKVYSKGYLGRSLEDKMVRSWNTEEIFKAIVEYENLYGHGKHSIAVKVEDVCGDIMEMNESTKTKEISHFIESLASDIELFMKEHPNAKPRDYMKDHPGLSPMSVQTAMYNARKKLGITATRGKGSYKDDRMGAEVAHTNSTLTSRPATGKNGWTGTGDSYSKGEYHLYRVKMTGIHDQAGPATVWKLSKGNDEAFGVQTIAPGFVKPNVAKDIAESRFIRNKEKLQKFIDDSAEAEDPGLGVLACMNNHSANLKAKEPEEKSLLDSENSWLGKKEGVMGYWFEGGKRLIHYCPFKSWMSEDPFFEDEAQAENFIVDNFGLSEKRSDEVVEHARKAKCPISF